MPDVAVQLVEHALREVTQGAVELGVGVGLEEAHQRARALARVGIDEALVEGANHPIRHLFHALGPFAEPAQHDPELGHVSKCEVREVEHMDLRAQPQPDAVRSSQPRTRDRTSVGLTGFVR